MASNMTTKMTTKLPAVQITPYSSQNFQSLTLNSPTMFLIPVRAVQADSMAAGAIVSPKRDTFLAAQNIPKKFQSLKPQQAMKAAPPKKESNIDLAALEARIKKLENEGNAALEARVQKLEKEKTAAVEATQKLRQRVTALEALNKVCEQQNAHLKDEQVHLKKEVHDLREKLGIQQRHIQGWDIRQSVVDDRLQNYMEQTKKELEEVKNDKMNEQILAHFEECGRYLYMLKNPDVDMGDMGGDQGGVRL